VKLAKLLDKPEATRFFTPDNRFILPDARIGVEFEFEHTGIVARNRQLPVTAWSHYWQWHEEGSIRDGGSEFAFVEPLFGRDAILAIEGLCRYADENGWRSTLRTGLHVHLDVRDLEVPQLVGFCVLYALYEPVIYNWIGDNRENSHFCVPWYKAEGSIMEAGAILRSANKPSEGANQELLGSSERYQRYAALNLNALMKFGSIEARHMKTTTDVTRILRWINLLMAIKRATARLPQSDTAIVRTVEHEGGLRSIQNILGPEFSFLNYRDMEADIIERGIPTANELIREGLTVNLWDAFMARPRGMNDGFRRFLERDVAPAVAPPPQVAQEPQPAGLEAQMFMDELAPILGEGLGVGIQPAWQQDPFVDEERERIRREMNALMQQAQVPPLVRRPR